MARKDILGRAAGLADKAGGTLQAERVIGALVQGQGMAEPVRSLETIGAEIRDLAAGARAATLWYAIEIGRRLREAKAACGHGEWLPWLKRETEFSERKAQTLMQVYEAYGAKQKSLFGAELENAQAFAGLSFTKALALLALPEEEREDFVEVHDVEGMSTRQLQEAIKAKESEMRAQYDALADEYAAYRVEAGKARAALADAEKNAGDQAKQIEEQGASIAALREQVRELESRPVDVAVQDASEEQLQAIRDEMQGKLDKAVKERARAEQEKEQALLALRQADTAKESAEKKAEDAEKLREQAEKEKAEALKGAKIGGDKDLAAFEVYFNQGQEIVNKLRGLLLKIRNRGDEETAGKLETAIRALAVAVGRAAE